MLPVTTGSRDHVDSVYCDLYVDGVIIAGPQEPFMTTALKTETPAPYMGLFETLPREHGFEPLRIEGTLPADLLGTLYRNGPSRFESFGYKYQHLFDGDGGVSAVRFTGTGALGAAKVVQSEGLLEEQRAGRRLYGGYG